MSKIQSQREARAYELADEVRAAAAILEKISWDIDAALSAINKDRAGYRQDKAANGSGGANAVPGELDEALAAANRIIGPLRDLVALSSSAPAPAGPVIDESGQSSGFGV